MPFNDAAKNAMLDALDESNTQITHIGAFGVVDPGTGTNAAGTEATGGSPAYARQSVTWGAAASGLKTNTNAIAIDVPAGTYAFLGYFNHVSTNSGNYRGSAPMGGASALKGFFSSDVIANDKLWSAGHGMANGDRVQLFNVFAESLPTGLTEGTLYYVVGSATDSFQVSATLGGAAIDITATGEGYWQRVVPEVFASQGQITIAIGALTLDANAM